MANISAFPPSPHSPYLDPAPGNDRPRRVRTLGMSIRREERTAYLAGAPDSYEANMSRRLGVSVGQLRQEQAAVNRASSPLTDLELVTLDVLATRGPMPTTADVHRFLEAGIGPLPYSQVHVTLDQLADRGLVTRTLRLGWALTAAGEQARL